MSDLYHVIYTNASEYGVAQSDEKDGFRFVLPQPSWQPQSQVKNFAAWVQSLNATSTDAVGYAYTCFRLNLHPCVCVAVVFPEFAPDETGRSGGSLTHVFVTPVKEGRDAGLHHILALVDLALKIKLPDVAGHSTRLTRYLEQPRDNKVEVPALQPHDLKAVMANGCGGTEEFLSLIKLAYTTVKRSGDSLLRVPNTGAGAQKLATCALALPPRLRLAFYWGCEISTGVSGRRQAQVRIKGDPGFPPEPDGRLYVYAERFMERLERLSPQDQDWLTSLWNEWDIRSWDELFARYGE